MKKKKEYNVFMKIRAALRDIWRYSPQHREAIKLVTDSSKRFRCPICDNIWPIELATVDHQPPLGSLQGFKNCTLSTENLGDWAERLFNGPVRVICKPCHRKVTSEQRKRK